MTETSATKPPQLRAARARKQSIIKFVILFVTLAFLFVPLLAMLSSPCSHPLVRPLVGPRRGIAIFTGNGESLGADLTVLWQGIGTSLALSAVTVVIMLVLLVPTMVIVHIRSKVLERAIRMGGHAAADHPGHRAGGGFGPDLPLAVRRRAEHQPNLAVLCLRDSRDAVRLPRDRRGA